MPKYLKTSEIPDDPKELYIKLYCEQVGNVSSATKHRAAQSWISLSHSKKKHFLKTCIQKQILNAAQRISSTEPFLKQLDGTIPLNENDNDTVVSVDTEINDSVCDNEDNPIEENVTECVTTQHTAEIEKDHTVLSINDEQTPNNNTPMSERSTHDILENLRDVVDPDNETDNVNEPLEDEVIREPMPPTVMNSKELYMLLNKGTCKIYKDLPIDEKYAYVCMLKKIRSDYIQNYMKYLESLSSKELYAHYLKQS